MRTSKTAEPPFPNGVAQIGHVNNLTTYPKLLVMEK